MLRRCAETFRTTSGISKSKQVLIHALFKIWTLHPIRNKNFKGCRLHRNPKCHSLQTSSKHIQTKNNKGELRLELELLKRFEAVQMEIVLHICSFQNLFSLFFLFLTEWLRIPFLFTLTASFIRDKPIEESSYAYILFQTVFTWLFQLHSKSGGLWFNKSVNNAKGTIMPGPGPEDFIFQHPLKPEAKVPKNWC